MILLFSLTSVSFLAGPSSGWGFSNTGAWRAVASCSPLGLRGLWSLLPRAPRAVAPHSLGLGELWRPALPWSMESCGALLPRAPRAVEPHSLGLGGLWRPGLLWGLEDCGALLSDWDALFLRFVFCTQWIETKPRAQKPVGCQEWRQGRCQDGFWNVPSILRNEDTLRQSRSFAYIQCLLRENVTSRKIM